MTRLKRKLDETLYPVGVYFNTIPDRSFIRVLRDFSKGIGSGFEETSCNFPEDLDPCDEPFEGVEFGIFNREVIISNKEFLIYLEEVCDNYIEDYPNDKEEVTKLLELIKERFNKK